MIAAQGGRRTANGYEAPWILLGGLPRLHRFLEARKTWYNYAKDKRIQGKERARSYPTMLGHRGAFLHHLFNKL